MNLLLAKEINLTARRLEYLQHLSKPLDRATSYASIKNHDVIEEIENLKNQYRDVSSVSNFRTELKAIHSEPDHKNKPKKNILIKAISFRCPVEMSNAIEDLSDQLNRHSSDIIREAVQSYLLQSDLEAADALPGVSK